MLKSILSPQHSVAVGVAIGAVDVFIFNQHIPNFADIRSAQPLNDDVDAGRRQATIMCTAVNGLVSLMTRDWNVFLIGGIVTVGLSWFAAHANAVNPQTGKLNAPGGESIAPDMNSYPMPDYSSGSEAA